MGRQTLTMCSASRSSPSISVARPLQVLSNCSPGLDIGASRHSTPCFIVGFESPPLANSSCEQRSMRMGTGVLLVTQHTILTEDTTLPSKYCRIRHRAFFNSKKRPLDTASPVYGSVSRTHTATPEVMPQHVQVCT